MRYVAELDPPNQPPDPAVILLSAVADDYTREEWETEVPAATIEKLELVPSVGGPEADGLTLFPGDHGFKTLAKHFGG